MVTGTLSSVISEAILGHAKLAITADLYVHVLDDTKIKGMKKMDKV